MVSLMPRNLKTFQERSLAALMPFAFFLDTIHRGCEVFLIALAWT
jgi:hypothetical protein